MSMPPTELAVDSIASGPPLEEISDLVSGPRIDDMLRRAAERAPDRVAVRTEHEAITYRDLDAKVSACAAGLAAALGGSETVVALALVLQPAFPVAFYALARSGHVPALVNPMAQEDRLAHILAAGGASAAIVSPTVYRRLQTVRDRLPDLERIILTHRDGSLGSEADDLPTLDELIGDTGSQPAPLSPAAPDDLGCLQFTSGTTGAPKAVRLSHRNMLVNAAQTAHAHRIDESSVVFNYLPAFHAMHLTISVTAASTLVLWTGDDIPGSVEAANRYRATHYYTLPVRLSHLASDPRLTELEAPSLRAVLSGGSALPVRTATVLGQHFGIPIVQGFGMQETSPLTHFDDLERPRTGSVGRPTAGTECRVVDPSTREVLPVGARGELQVRGPQLMLGYLGRDLSNDVDEDGWFSTGDITYMDPDGRVFVVDRIKDVFKCDNWLVSPSEIERVLLRHPAVEDCAVVDYPDEFSGAVPYGLVVPSQAGVGTRELADFVAARLTHYEHLRHVEIIDEVPRSPQGKVQRRQLRERLLERDAADRR